MRFWKRIGARLAGRLRLGAFAAAGLLALASTPACVSTVNEASKPSPNDAEFRFRLDELGRAYESRDLQKIMEMYVEDTYSLSFDQTHAFDSGAADHRGTIWNALKDVTALDVKWEPDVAVDRTSRHVWTTRRFVANARLSSGELREVAGWHSAIWTESGGKWLIEYEHFRADGKLLAAAPQPPPPPPAGPSPEEAEAAVRGSIRDVFFDYDKWNLRDDQLPSIGVVLDYLKRYPTTEMTIEGHCDERGTTQYNIRLGQRRADEAKAWLVGQGVEAGRLRTISFGKSRPFEEGRSENAWQSNRRAHFVVTKGPQGP